MSRIAVYPGSFDPITNGHVYILKRSLKIFDHLVVALAVNVRKTPLFSVDERREMILDAVDRDPRIEVDAFEGLLVDYCAVKGMTAIVKGIRAVSDFDYELQMAQMNHGLTGVDTLFLPTSPTYSFVSSSLVKQVAGYGGDVSHLLPDVVSGALRDKLAAR